MDEKNVMADRVLEVIQNSNIQKLAGYQTLLNSIMPQVPEALQRAIETERMLQESGKSMLLQLNPLAEWVSDNQRMIASLTEGIMRIKSLAPPSVQLLSNPLYVQSLSNLLSGYSLAHVYPKDTSEEERKQIEDTDKKIIGEIFRPEPAKMKKDKDSAIIILSPINDEVLKYLSENPEAMYQLTGSEFEEFMAEIYRRLGYEVTRTQETRDGGKDIIIRKPEILGDFIYYVECKKYAADRKVGLGIVKGFLGTIDVDRVNGGILATTSFFTRDAREFITEEKLNYQIKTQDYNDIRNLLNKVV